MWVSTKIDYTHLIYQIKLVHAVIMRYKNTLLLNTIWRS